MDDQNREKRFCFRFEKNRIYSCCYGKNRIYIKTIPLFLMSVMIFGYVYIRRKKLWINLFLKKY